LPLITLWKVNTREQRIQCVITQPGRNFNILMAIDYQDVPSAFVVTRCGAPNTS
jgi:hypothetical protein